MIPQMSEPVALVVGIFLMVLGVSFLYKAYQAGIQGRLMYWEGFLPFTLISPFLLHLPAGKRSLVKPAEGLWVHAVMAPIFGVIGILMLAAGADYTGLPGVATLNVAMNGFKWGRSDSVVFNRRNLRRQNPRGRRQEIQSRQWLLRSSQRRGAIASRLA
jgi:hypothetical protein